MPLIHYISSDKKRASPRWTTHHEIPQFLYKTDFQIRYLKEIDQTMGSSTHYERMTAVEYKPHQEFNVLTVGQGIYTNYIAEFNIPSNNPQTPLF